MKKLPLVFLKGVIILIALATLAFLIFFPPQEGRARDLDLLSIYLDPVILYAYAASIAFFTALYKAFQLLGLIGDQKIFTPEAVKALRGIRNCALILGASIILLAVFIRITHSAEDDPAGFIAMSFVLCFATLVVATAAAIFGRVLQGAIDIKSEKELTI
ncbi:DUF2975 domain-containing protein [Jiulongibacter sediminis]|jgi:drug/metabolite transporter (DMT)-like permease|uniref:DUF2975 domain-containing protein n=1 Tax=Jiulongibacter sediminis TaxID=1605367 RepID=UPI0026F22ED2|nr:DUF2975 domain-containing protein [Jiulongibacter sediminis]